MTDAFTKIEVRCSCGQRMKVPVVSEGKLVRCVRCGEAVLAVQGKAAEESERPRSLIGQLMLKANLISQEQLSEALELQQREGGKTFEILLHLGHLDEEKLHAFLSQQPGVATIELSRFQIDRKLLDLVPRELAVESKVLPIDQLGKLLTVAMACPLDRETIEVIEDKTELKVKAMLCKLDAINAAVEKYYPAEGEEPGAMPVFQLPPEYLAASREPVERKIEVLEEIPVQGAVLAQMSKLGENSAVPLKKVAAWSASDPVFSAYVLQMANCAAYGFMGQIDSIPMAVGLLDVEGITSVLAQCVEGDFEGALDVKRRNEHAIQCARLTEVLARYSEKVFPQTAFVAGLLHELGRYALAAISPRRYKRIGAELLGRDAMVAEDDSFTLTYPEVGGKLAVRWRFPGAICQAIRYHLTPQEAETDVELVYLVAIATRMLSGKTVPDEWLTPLALDTTLLGRAMTDVQESL